MSAKLSVDLLLIILIIMEVPAEAKATLHRQEEESFSQQSALDELYEQTKIDIEQINDEVKSQQLSNHPNKFKK